MGLMVIDYISGMLAAKREAYEIREIKSMDGAVGGAYWEFIKR